MNKPEDTLTGAVAGVAVADVDSEPLPSIQREIQRKFGRNLIRLQEYERLMKALVAEHDIAGPIDALNSIKALQSNAVSKKTLGQVVGDLTRAYIVPAIPESASQQDDGHLADPNVAWARIRFQISMKEEDVKQTQRKLADLVNLRNELVHHFLEKHNILTEVGCLTAGTYLDDCFNQIDTHYEELREWVKHNLQARDLMVGFMRTPAFHDFLDNGIMPGGAGVFWAASTIVNLLVDAETTFSKDGWTLLQHAIDYIGQHVPEHTPTRYGCRSWRHVLHESEQFEVRREQPAPGMPTATWYRSRLG